MYTRLLQQLDTLERQTQAAQARLSDAVELDESLSDDLGATLATATTLNDKINSLVSNAGALQTAVSSLRDDIAYLKDTTGSI